MKLVDKLTGAFAKNPIAWVLSAFFVFSVYSHYNTGKKFTEVCALAAEMIGMPVDSAAFQQLLDNPKELDAWLRRYITAPSSVSLEGKVWAWKRIEGRQIENLCEGRHTD